MLISMNKDELIGVHRLLSLILKNAESNSDFDVNEAFGMEEYEEMNVKPNAIHKTNDKHEEAILELATRLGQGIEEHGDEVEIIDTGDESVPVSEMKQTRDRAKEIANSSTGIEPKESQGDTQDSVEDSQAEEDSVDTSGPDWSKMG